MGDRKPTPSSLARGLAPPKPPRQQQQHLLGKDKEDEGDGKLPPSKLLATKGEHESVFEYLLTVFEVSLASN